MIQNGTFIRYLRIKKCLKLEQDFRSCMKINQSIDNVNDCEEIFKQWNMYCIARLYKAN